MVRPLGLGEEGRRAHREQLGQACAPGGKRKKGGGRKREKKKKGKNNGKEKKKTRKREREKEREGGRIRGDTGTRSATRGAWARVSATHGSRKKQGAGYG